MLKKDLNKIGRVKWKKVGGRGEGFPRTEKMRDCSHIYLKVSILAYSMEKHSRKESELKTFERKQT